tara:strand:- start:91 stop:312 length:222 start_codon:yes stop_codon:yes gene_type:complete
VIILLTIAATSLIFLLSKQATGTKTMFKFAAFSIALIALFVAPQVIGMVETISDVANQLQAVSDNLASLGKIK